MNMGIMVDQPIVPLLQLRLDPSHVLPTTIKFQKTPADWRIRCRVTLTPVQLYFNTYHIFYTSTVGGFLHRPILQKNFKYV